jgi:hypothetical protein
MEAHTMTKKLERMQHNARSRNGQYRVTPKCDGCGKPIGTNYFTDSDICGGSDGPGFYICDRVRCAKRLEGLNVEQRRAVYEATRNGEAPTKAAAAQPKPAAVAKVQPFQPHTAAKAANNGRSPFSDEAMKIITGALKVAARVYRADARAAKERAAVDGGWQRLADQFSHQAADASALLEALEF